LVVAMVSAARRLVRSLVGALVVLLLPAAHAEYSVIDTSSGVFSCVLWVHLGKAAGGSVRHFLQANGVYAGLLNGVARRCSRKARSARGKLVFYEVHVTKVHATWLRNMDAVVVSLRDPVARLVSAFNWRHLDGGGHVLRPESTLALEQQLYSCYPHVEDFAQAVIHNATLHPRSHCARVMENALHPPEELPKHHLSMGLDFYIGDLLRSGELAKIPIYALRSENLAADLVSMSTSLGLRLRTRETGVTKSGYPRKHDALSGQTAALLRQSKALQEEYDIYNALLNIAVNKPQARAP